MNFDFSDRNSFGKDATKSSAEMLIRAFLAQGCAVDQLAKFFRITHKGQICFVHASDTSFTSTLATKIWNNKLLSRKVLNDAGITIPRGRAFGPGEGRRAERLCARLGRAVVKPVDGTKGRGVSIDVSVENFSDAWKSARSFSGGKVLVEAFFAAGQEARYLVLDEKCIAVSFRFPPKLTGDGVQSVAQLVEQENRLKFSTNPSRSDSPILLDPHRVNLLAAQGLSPQSVPPMGQILALDYKTNLSTGGYCYEDLSLAHPGFRALAEQAAKTVPGSHVLGVDIVAKDHSIAPDPGNHVVLEANTKPGLRVHMYPDYGQPNDVVQAIVDSCFEKMGVTA